MLQSTQSVYSVTQQYTIHCTSTKLETECMDKTCIVPDFNAANTQGLGVLAGERQVSPSNQRMAWIVNI